MRRRGAHEIDGVEDDLGMECEAFLAGRYVTWLEQEGLPVPAWARLNVAAHGDYDDVLAGAARRPVPDHATTFEEAGHTVQAIVAETTRPDDLARVQRDVLVPLELELATEALSPRAVVQRVLEALC